MIFSYTAWSRHTKCKAQFWHYHIGKHLAKEAGESIHLIKGREIHKTCEDYVLGASTELSPFIHKSWLPLLQKLKDNKATPEAKQYVTIGGHKVVVIADALDATRLIDYKSGKLQPPTTYREQIRLYGWKFGKEIGELWYLEHPMSRGKQEVRVGNTNLLEKIWEKRLDRMAETAALPSAPDVHEPIWECTYCRAVDCPFYQPEKENENE